MKALSKPITGKWKVGPYLVEATTAPDDMGGIQTAIEWSPDLPRRLSKKQVAQYREGRNKFFKLIADEIGGSVLVVEV